MLYQPHGGGPAGLPVCGATCETKVRDAMSRGPVVEPLEVGSPPMMPSDLRAAMESDLLEEMKEEAMEKKKLGPLVRALRMTKGFSRVQVEESTENISAQFLADVEEGRRPLDAEQCAVLAALFEVDTDVLLEAATAFHTEFWQSQGVRPETEITIGRTQPALVETAKLKDEVVRLRSDLKDGLDIMSEVVAGLRSNNEDVDPALAWVKRAEAALERVDAVLGIKDRPEKWAPPAE